VVDDGSTDNTEEVVNGYDDKRVKYIKFEENKGANAARNAGIREATAEFVSFLDSDDTFEPAHLEYVMTLIKQNNNEVNGIYTGHRKVEDGAVIRVRNAKTELSDPLQVIEKYNVGGFSVLTFRKDVFETVGYLRENLSAFQDREFLIRYLDTYDLAPANKILVTYHRHGERLSENFDEKLNALDKYVNIHEERFTKEAWAYIHYIKGFLYSNKQEMRTANRHFRKALFINPKDPRYAFQFVASILGKRLFDTANMVKNRLLRA
jgi:glycosyltransferase involved in cell wall biosynthesis